MRYCQHWARTLHNNGFIFLLQLKKWTTSYKCSMKMWKECTEIIHVSVFKLPLMKRMKISLLTIIDIYVSNETFRATLKHCVWKSQKKSHSTLRAKRATFTFWVDKSSLKMPKMVHFGVFLKTWSLRSNSVTRQVSFNRTKIGGRCQNSQIQMRHFG